MKAVGRSLIIAAAVVAAAVGQQVSAQDNPDKKTALFGTTGACNNAIPGGVCTTQSTLVEIDPDTGALIRTIGPVGFTVNGLAWDEKTHTLYASTPPGDALFHGLLTIDRETGAGTPVDASVVNFGLAGSSPIHSITVDRAGQMVGWYDEFPPPVGITDTFVQINKRTGVATEFDNTGINTSQNGLSFDANNMLWNIDSPRFAGGSTTLTQTAYLLNPLNGQPLLSKLLTPPTPAAIGDFNPDNGLYYGLNFDSSFPPPFSPTFIVLVDVGTGAVTTLGQTADDLHTLAFMGKTKKIK
jgi:hypothetical protein